MNSLLSINAVVLGSFAGITGPQWLGIASVVVLFYAGLWYAAPAAKGAPQNREPTTSPHSPRIARTLIAGLIGFLLVDGLVFHTSLYPSILARQSYAGQVQSVVTRERGRGSSATKRILVAGDSRMAEGFSAERANEIAGPEWEFINASIAGSSPCVWHYLLRAIDPARGRYAAIVLPVEYRDVEPRVAVPGRPQDYSNRTLDISMAAPVLRYSDAFGLASSFGSWSNQCRAFAACLLRGVAYQADILDLVEHPFARLRLPESASDPSLPKRGYAGKPGNLLQVQYDPTTQTMITPPGFPGATRFMLEQSLTAPSKEGTTRWLAYRNRWLGSMFQRYAGSKTRIILMQLPRGPFVRTPRSAAEEESSLGSLINGSNTIALPRDRFTELETPEFFYDAHHPNSVGRQRITETLVHDVIAALSSGTRPVAEATPN